MKVIIEYPVEHPIEVSVKIHEEHAFIAIKKYGDAYEKEHNCCARWLYNQQFEMIDSQEHNKLINKLKY